MMESGRGTVSSFPFSSVPHAWYMISSVSSRVSLVMRATCCCSRIASAISLAESVFFAASRSADRFSPKVVMLVVFVCSMLAGDVM